MERALVLGAVDMSVLLHALYLVALGVFGVRHAGRRLATLLTT